MALFDNVWFFNTLLCIGLFYLLIAITFAAHFSACDQFGRPVLLNSFNLFSCFFISLLFWLFCFDFFPNDKLYFFSQNIQLLFVFFIVCVLYASYDFLNDKKILKYEYDLLFVFIVLSGICLCFCNDFLMLYLAIELQSLTLYIFATFNRNSEFSTESGLKYFVFGGIMSCFLLFGICLIYLFFGSLSFELFFSIANSGFDPIFFVGFLFVFIVLMFKVGAAPFHFWLCDVYEGAILPVTLLFASAPKVVLFSIFLKLCCFVLYDYSEIWANFIGLSAVLSIIVGSISGLYQKRLKRLFAFSTIVHAGFVLLALLAFSIDASKSLIFYISIYFALTITVFSILMNVAVTTVVPPKYLINYSSIGSKNYVFAITFCLVILSVAGIPPLAGFFSKLFVLISLIGSEYYTIGLIVIFFSTISCFYYIRFVKILFFAEKNCKNDIWITNNTKKNTQNIIGFFLFFILCFFVYPDLVIDFSFVVGLIFF